MAVTVLTGSVLTINGDDVSSKIKSWSLPLMTDEEDATTFGSGAVKASEPGLLGFGPLTVEFLNDYTDNDFDEDMYTLWAARAKFAVKAKIASGSPAPANPEFQFTGFISKMSHGGAVGKLAGGSLSVTNSGALTRAVS